MKTAYLILYKWKYFDRYRVQRGTSRRYTCSSGRGYYIRSLLQEYEGRGPVKHGDRSGVGIAHECVQLFQEKCAEEGYNVHAILFYYSVV